MNVITHRVFYVLAVLLLDTCAIVPITGRTQLMLIGDDRVRTASSLAFADLMRGAEQKGVVLSRSESPEAARILDQVNRVTTRILEASGLKDQYNWEVVVVKSNTRNAYVLPNGKIVVFGGLVQLAHNEGQIAAVMAHEVAHLAARHQAERLSQILLANVALSAVDLALANSKFRPIIGSALGLGIQYAVLLPYSREHETEADHIGLLYMAKAGYEPSEAIKFWDRMEAAGGRTSWDLSATHPSHENRRGRLQRWLPEATIYFADQSRPLPSNLTEVETAVRSRAEQSILAPEGLRPDLSPGFWVRVKESNRSTLTTNTFKGTHPCVIGECLVLESDAGSTSLISSDYEMVETRTTNGVTMRFNPPLRLIQWPLKVGSTLSYMTIIEMSQDAKIPTRVTGNVVSYESVTVPAGTFMAFRMIISLNGRRFQEIWWAPETRTGVRSIITNLNQEQIISELVDYQRSDDPAGAL
jgi:Zn-dependent protease with chaperone function